MLCWNITQTCPSDICSSLTHKNKISITFNARHTIWPQVIWVREQRDYLSKVGWGRGGSRLSRQHTRLDRSSGRAAMTPLRCSICVQINKSPAQWRHVLPWHHVSLLPTPRPRVDTINSCRLLPISIGLSSPLGHLMGRQNHMTGERCAVAMSAPKRCKAASQISVSVWQLLPWWYRILMENTHVGGLFWARRTKRKKGSRKKKRKKW